MKTTTSILLLLSATAIAGEAISHETHTEPDGGRIHEYRLHQESDRDTVAVIRVAHTIQGQLYEASEYLFYTPGDPAIGSLIVPDDRRKPEIDSPVGKIRPMFDKSYTELTTGSTKLKAALGAPRAAKYFQMRSDNEVIQVFLYSAPMKSAVKKVPTLPPVGTVSAFRNYENQLVNSSPLEITEDPDGKVIIKVLRDAAR